MALGTSFRFEGLAEGYYRIVAVGGEGDQSYLGRAKVAALGSEARVMLQVKVTKDK